MRKTITVGLACLAVILSAATASAKPSGEGPLWDHLCNAHGAAFAAKPPNGLPGAGLRAQYRRCINTKNPADW